MSAQGLPDCFDCHGAGFIIIRPARFGPDPEPEEAEPCWCVLPEPRRYVDVLRSAVRDLADAAGEWANEPIIQAALDKHASTIQACRENQ